MPTTRAYSALKSPSNAGEIACATCPAPPGIPAPSRAGSVMDDEASIHRLSTAKRSLVTAGRFSAPGSRHLAGQRPTERPVGTRRLAPHLRLRGLVPSPATPRNRACQPPTRSPREAKKRLDEKAATKKGSANKRRIHSKEAEES